MDNQSNQILKQLTKFVRCFYFWHVSRFRNICAHAKCVSGLTTVTPLNTTSPVRKIQNLCIEMNCIVEELRLLITILVSSVSLGPDEKWPLPPLNGRKLQAKPFKFLKSIQ